MFDAAWADYYGIEPIEELDIPAREEEKIEKINFDEIVEAKRMKKLQEMIEKK